MPHLTQTPDIPDAAGACTKAAQLRILSFLMLAGGMEQTGVTAGDMLNHFGCLGAVLRAAPEDLRAAGLDATQIAVLATAAEAADHLIWHDISGRDALTSWTEVERFFMTRLAHLPRERLVMVCLDNRNHLIACHTIADGTINQIPVYIRELARIALGDHARAVILAHNHPGGEEEPSKADIKMTAEIKDAFQPIDIILHDHLIVTPAGCVSFKNLGLL